MRETPDERRFQDGPAPRPSDARIQKGSLRLFRVAGKGPAGEARTGR